MANDTLKRLVAQGLSAIKAGSDVAARATGEINGDAKHPALKAMLGEGNRTSKQWTECVNRAGQHSTQVKDFDFWTCMLPLLRAGCHAQNRTNFEVCSFGSVACCYGQPCVMPIGTSLERTERHVREMAARIVIQEQRIREMENQNLIQALTVARTVLAQMYELQTIYRRNLERERARTTQPASTSPGRVGTYAS